MNKVNGLDEAAKLFDNNSDCYADTCRNEKGMLAEGDYIPAMTKDKFIQLFAEWQNQYKPSVILDEAAKDVVSEKYSYHKTEYDSYIIAYKRNTFEERRIAITDSAEKADFLCKAANFFDIEKFESWQNQHKQDGWVSMRKEDFKKAIEDAKTEERQQRNTDDFEAEEWQKKYSS